MSTAWGIPPRSAQRLQHHLADGLERVEHAVAADRDGFVVPRAADPLPACVLDEELPLVRGIRGDLLLRGFLDGPAGIERRLEVLDRRRVGQIALVVLDDERDLRQVVPVFGHVVVEVLHGFDVGFHALHLAVGDEYDAVHALEDELAARVVIHLARCITTRAASSSSRAWTASYSSPTARWSAWKPTSNPCRTSTTTWPNTGTT